MPGMTEVAQATVTIIPTMEGAQRTIAELLTGADVQFANGGRRMGDSMTSGFSAATVALGSVIGNLAMDAMNAFMGGIDAGIRRVDTLNNFGKVMQQLGESEESVTESINTIKAALDGLPSSTANIAALVQQVKATGLSLEDATDLTVALNNALLAGGQGTAVAEAAMQQYARALSRGEFHQREFDALNRAAPAQMAQVAQAILGVADATGQDLYEAMKKGDVSMQEFNDMVVRLNQEGGESFGTFEDQARAATGGIGTALQNVGNRIGAAWANIITHIGPERISGLINDISSQFGGIGEAIGTAIEPAADAFFGFIDDIKNGAIDLGGVFAPVTGAVGALLSQGILPALTKLPLLGGILQPLAGAIGGLSAPVLAVGGAFAAWAANCEPLTDALGEMFGMIGEALSSIDLEGIFAGIAEAFEPFTDTVGEFLAGEGPAFAQMVEYIGAAVEATTPAIDYARTAFENLCRILGGLMEALAPVIDAVGNAFVAAWGLAGAAVAWVAPVLTTIVGIIENVIAVVAEVATGVVAAVGWIIDAVVQAHETAAEGIAMAMEVIAPIPGQIVEFFAGIPDAIGGFFEAAGAAITGAMDSAASAVTSTWDGIVSFFAGIPGAIASAVAGVTDALTAPFRTAWDFISGIPGQIAGIFSSFKIQLPSFTLPHIDWHMESIAGILQIPVFDGISWHARGGIVDEATLFGAGEAGPELIWPAYDPYMSKYAQAIAEHMPDGGNTTNVYVDGSLLDVNRRAREAFDLFMDALALDMDK